ncbi:hypothetical protein SCUP515_05195 [Seiridium cupressi]
MVDRPPYSDLEVAPDRGSSLQVVHGDGNYPEVLPEQWKPPAYSDAPENVYASPHGQEPKKRDICGLVPWLFWTLVVAAVIIVIGAGVGGGVGATMSKKNTDSVAPAGTTAPSPANTVASTPTSATGSTATVASDLSSMTSLATTSTNSAELTTTQVVGSSTTLYRDCPSSNNTQYTALGDSTYQYRKLCNDAFLVQSVPETVNVAVASLDACIDLCAQYNKNNEADIKSGKANICNAVCWRNRFETDWPAQCFGNTLKYGAGGQIFPSNDTTNEQCDSAAWTNAWSVP